MIYLAQKGQFNDKTPTKGSLQIEFLEKFGNLAQPGRPPPPPPKLGPPKLKKNFDVYFAF